MAFQEESLLLYKPIILLKFFQRISGLCKNNLVIEFVFVSIRTVVVEDE